MLVFDAAIKLFILFYIYIYIYIKRKKRNRKKNEVLRSEGHRKRGGICLPLWGHFVSLLLD